MARLEFKYLLKLASKLRGGGEVVELYPEKPTEQQILALAKQHRTSASECRIFPISDANRDRLLAMAKWNGWKREVAHRGMKLGAVISQIEQARFMIVFSDERGGSQQRTVEKNLNRLQANALPGIVRRLLQGIPTNSCKQCGRTSIQLTPDDAREPGLCRPCFMGNLKRYRREDRARSKAELAARMEEHRREGHRYLARVWIHPKSGGDDWCVETGFLRKPTRDQLRAIARKNQSAILDDSSVFKIE